MSSNAKAEEVEECNAQGDYDARPQYSRIVNHLVPTTGKVKERGTRSQCNQNGHEDNNGGCSEETFEADSIQWGDGILFHYLFLNEELCCSAEDGSYKVRKNCGGGKNFTDKS